MRSFPGADREGGKLGKRTGGPGFRGSSLHLGRRVIDGDAHALVQDLEAVELGRAHGAILVGAGERDVEGQHLVGVPGRRELRVLTRGGQGRIQLVDLRAGGNAGRAHDRGLEYRTAIGGAGVLRPDLVDIGNEGAGTVLDEVQQRVTVEVDPDQAAGNAALVAGIGARVGNSSQVYTGAFSRVTE